MYAFLLAPLDATNAETLLCVHMCAHAFLSVSLAEALMRVYVLVHAAKLDTMVSCATLCLLMRAYRMLILSHSSLDERFFSARLHLISLRWICVSQLHEGHV